MSFKRHPLMRFVRDEPLEHCPDAVCRRSGICHAQNPEWECRRYVREINEWREYIARKLYRLGGMSEKEIDRAMASPARCSDEEWSQVVLPAVREAIASIKAERAQKAGREALLKAEAPAEPVHEVSPGRRSSPKRPKPAAH
jgi:hypothetical protein